MKRGRRLQYETLESRHLLSADFAADVFVDGGAYLSGISLQREANLLGWTTDTLLTRSIARTRAGIQSLLDAEGQPQYPVLFVNGGKSGTHGRALGPAGRQTIVDFVMAGGSYVGSCAGAFLASDHSRSVLQLWKGWMGSNGRGTHTVSFAKTPDHPIAQFLVAHGIEDMTVRSIPHIGGPRYNVNARHPEGTVFLGEIISSTRSLRRTVGTPYLIEYQPTPESGVLLLQPSHPEYGRRLEHTILNAAILQYARDRSQVGHNVTLPAAEGEYVLNDWVTVQTPLFIDLPAKTQDKAISVENNVVDKVFAELATEQKNIDLKLNSPTIVDEIFSLGLDLELTI